MKGLSIPVSDADHSDGPQDAPITLVEYGDYQCPYCGEAYPVLKAVQKAMGNRMRLVFRNFPITEIHPHALAAARFAEAAAEVGLFWQAHDLLYQRQNALSDEDLCAYARELGLDSALLDAASNGAFDARIERDFMGGVRSGVNGTPCLFINGVRYDGPCDTDTLVDAMTALL
ncbi:disulfide bond formation protein DsbA [Stenotrophomonas sp. ESTM1D_MKCIP4_1]|uniref:DsbA family protein n=1 Tax=Stenotrophomonas sp. ESTM1D_MKCIP4_1 TaxID=2072414 RepID=UPI000D53F790|nr:DsbA family protein [Stenotrophomonas sp. ESTM1D_MKCIP4_1]AWH55069.1 disulfide bond formation protein DsbA [Stenotrophomonas sp. ESTM1D_MKCIP4_1]